MFTFDCLMPRCNSVTATIEGDASGHQAFMVLTDAGGEQHLFPLGAEARSITMRKNRGAVTNGGEYVVNVPIAIANPMPADYYAQRWGGDDNQRIDFSIRSITLGMNDLPDEAVAKGRIVFKKLVFFVR